MAGTPQPATLPPARPSLTWVLLGAIGGGLAAAVLAGLLAGRFGAPIGGALLLAAAALGALPGALSLLRGRWEARWPEAIAAALAAVIVAAYGLWMAWPSLLPLGLSVDGVHHYQLVRWIYDHHALPPIDQETQMRLGEMVQYPPGLTLLVAGAAELLGVSPIYVLYPFVALLGGLIAAAVVALAASAGSARSWPGALVLGIAPLLLLAHRTYLLEAYLDHSYYTMVLGVLLVLLACGQLLAAPRLNRTGALQCGLLLAALLGVYPLWWPIPAALALGLLLLDRAAGFRSRLLLLALALLPSLAVGAIDLPQRLAVGGAVLEHQGLVATPTAQALMPLALGLLAVPFVVVTSGGRRLLAAAGLALAMFAALRLAAGQGSIASYHSTKLLFLLTPLAAATAAAGVAWIANAPGTRLRAGGLAGAGLALLLAGSYRVVPPPPIQMLTPGLVSAAEWLRASDPREASRAVVVGVPPGPAAYWVQVGLLGQRRDKATWARQAFASAPPSAAGWALDSELPGVAIAGATPAPPPGAEALARFDNAAVLRREKPLDVAALNPLTIRYQASLKQGRINAAIELRQPAGGRIPSLEVSLLRGGQPVARYPLPPNQQRTRTQYLGVDIAPGDLSASGYINRDAFPAFAALRDAPNGNLELWLRVLVDGNVVDQRPLASFTRSAEGAIEQASWRSGDLVYMRNAGAAAGLKPVAAAFGNGIALVGLDIPPIARPGEDVSVDLRWNAPDTVAQSLEILVELRDEIGRVVASQQSAPQAGFYPTWRWRPGEAVAERRVLRLPPVAQPGRYTLQLSVLGGEDQGAPITIGEVEISPSAAERPVQIDHSSR